LTRLIGRFFNILPIRFDLSGDSTFPDLVARARRPITAAFAHHDVAYGHLLRTLRPPWGRFFDVAFQCRNFPPSRTEGGAASFEEVPFDWGLAQWDLLVEITPRASGPDVRICISAGKWSPISERDGRMRLRWP
jgi:nonribosomal peptide synthetase DhbF